MPNGSTDLTNVGAAKTGQAVEGELTAPGLGVRQQAALDLLCCGTSVAETARTAGVSRVTIYNWIRHDPVFRAAYNQWQEEMEESCRARLAMLTGKATMALEKALEAGDAKAAVQLLRGMGIIRASERRATDSQEVRRRAGVEAKKLENELEEAERRADLDREVSRVMDGDLAKMMVGDGPPGTSGFAEGKKAVRRWTRREGEDGVTG